MHIDAGWVKAGQRLLIPTPAIIDQRLRASKPGDYRDLKDFRDQLAQDHQANITCPMTTSIFLRIAVEAAIEREDLEALPFWRVLPLTHKIIKTNHLEDLWIEMTTKEKNMASK